MVSRPKNTCRFCGVDIVMRVAGDWRPADGLALACPDQPKGHKPKPGLHKQSRAVVNGLTKRKAAQI